MEVVITIPNTKLITDFGSKLTSVDPKCLKKKLNDRSCDLQKFNVNGHNKQVHHCYHEQLLMHLSLSLGAAGV